MKNILLLIFLICTFFYTYSQYNGGAVIYKQKIIIPERAKTSKNAKFFDLVNADRKEMNEISEQIFYNLQFNKHEALFQSKESMDIKSSDDAVELTKIHVEGDGKRYFSTKSNISLWAHEAFGKKIILIDTIKSDDWTITSESKNIGKYRVTKAIKKKVLHNKKTIEVIAWFAPEIPFRYGPVGYNGLPGLILELHGYDFILYAEEISIIKKPPKIKKPSKGKYMTKTKYNEYIDKSVEKMLYK